MQLPNFMQLCVFITFSLSGGYFSASNIFTTMQLFNVMRGPVTQFPSGLSQLANLIIAMRRIGYFLKRDERAQATDAQRQFSLEKPAEGEAAAEQPAAQGEESESAAGEAAEEKEAEEGEEGAEEGAEAGAAEAPVVGKKLVLKGLQEDLSVEELAQLTMDDLMHEVTVLEETLASMKPNMGAI